MQPQCWQSTCVDFSALTMLTVAQRIRELPRLTGVKLTTACEARGLRYKTLNAQLNRNRGIPFSTIDALADFYNLPIEYFSPRRGGYYVSPPIPGDPTNVDAKEATMQLREVDRKVLKAGLMVNTDTVLDWLDRENCVLQNFGFLKDRFDLFYPAMETDRIIKPALLGAKSLASIFFDLTDAADYLRKVGSFPSGVRGELVRAHVSVHRTSKYRVDDIEISVPIADATVAGRYRRIMAPVVGENQAKFTFVYARLIRAFVPKEDGQNAISTQPLSNGSPGDPAVEDQSR